MEVRRRAAGVEKWRYRGMELRRGAMGVATWRYGDIEVWRHVSCGDMEV